MCDLNHKLRATNWHGGLDVKRCVSVSIFKGLRGAIEGLGQNY